MTTTTFPDAGKQSSPRGALHTIKDLTQEKLDFIKALASERGGTSADFDTICEGIAFRVHRINIGMHPLYFERLCEGPFRESGQRSVVLRDDEPQSLMEVHSHVFTLADKYGMPGLKDLAFEN